MADRLYIMPLVNLSVAPGGRTPRYADPIMGAKQYLNNLAWTSMDYGALDIGVVRAIAIPDAVHLKMIGEGDVISALDSSKTIADIVTLRTRMEAIGMPGDWISSTLTYDAVFDKLQSMFQFAQRMHGMGGGKVLPAGVTLDTQFSALPAGLRQKLRDVAASFSFDASELTATTKLRRVLMAMAEQWKPTIIGPRPSTLTDSFTRADETPIAGNWTNENRSLKLASNAVGQNSSTDCCARYTASSWNNDQSSQVTVVTFSGDYLGAAVRIASGAATYYDFQTIGPPVSYLRKCVTGTTSNLGTGANTFSGGDALLIDATGTTITGKKNGSNEVSVTDSAISSGSAGIAAYGIAGSSRLDDWQGTGEVTTSTRAGASSRHVPSLRSGRW